LPKSLHQETLLPAQDPAAFISYSREDSEFALRLAQDLKAAGAHVWLDQLDIQPGRPWDNAIEQALGEAVHMLIILSPSSAKSENVRNEISYALEQGKIIVPVLYQDCVVPLQLQRAQRIDFRADYARGLNHLLQHLHVTAPDPSVLQKAAEGDAQRQAAWQARELEAQRMKELARRQNEDEAQNRVPPAEPAPRRDGANWQKPGVLIPIVVVLALLILFYRPGQKGSPQPGPVPVSTGPDPIAGCYQWFNNGLVVIRADHTMTGGPFTATWQLVNAATRAYTFTWQQPVISTIAVSPDQQSISGGDQYGFSIAGTRTAGSSGLVGTWNWYADGQIVTVNANGTYSAAMSTGTFPGTWQPKFGSPGVYILTASDLPKDSVTLSADGTRVSGADQYGLAISGVRTQPCNLN
jgi:hypothetical protein